VLGIRRRNLPTIDKIKMSRRQEREEREKGKLAVIILGSVSLFHPN